MAISLFAKKQPVDDPIPERGGKHVLRQAISLRVRKKENLHTLVQTINAPQDKILEFASGADNLNEAQLSAVAMYVFGNATYDATLDKLVSTAKPPETFAPNGPPQWNQGQVVYPPVATNKASAVNPDPKLSIGTNDITPKYVRGAGWA